jgi:ATP-dependent helicase/nuclease subunit A
VAELLPFPPAPTAPPDAAARAHALDIRQSFIVEAPAGSGKTGLLIQRFLKLLADESVESPEQVLAITFTNKATAELRERVLHHLEQAHLEPPPPTHNDFDRETRTLARAVLLRDHQLGWSLLDHPHRLHLRTIDSVCAEIARTLPILSGSGGRLTPAQDADPLHREAARSTLLLLGSGDAAFDQALRTLLLHRDGNLAECESLIANMLSLRDQWGDLIPLTRPELDDTWLDTNVLPRLELALDHAICAALTHLTRTFPPHLLAELTALAAELGRNQGYGGNPSPIALCADLRTAPAAVSQHLDHWRALIHLLITPSNNTWRKSFNVNHVGFEHDRRHKTQLKSLTDQLSNHDDLLTALCDVRNLPPATYPADQWLVTKSLFRILSRALVELQLVFAAHAQCDFTELSLLARHALTQDSGADDLASALGARLQHLLVDEMQDTSTSQYDLIQRLTATWDGHSQTVFLVGDPRQSIYLFRQARVERFLHAMHTQLFGDLPLTRLRLTANFRSQATLVEQFNENFNLIFPPSANPETLPSTPATPTLPPSPNAAATVWHTHALPAAAPESAQLRQTQSRHEANEILHIARTWLAKPVPPNRTEPWSIAVLVRSRNHLAEIVSTLRQHPEIPFRAVEIESLHQRQEVLDLTALTRALLHPADRVAALAILRAPWCGLSLADLHTLTGADSDDPTFRHQSISRLMAERGHLLSSDGCDRLTRIWTVLQSASTQRAALTFAQLVERAWLTLGGDTWLTPTQLTNTRRFFHLLDDLESESEAHRIDPTLLESRLRHLYAEPDPIPANTPFVELLTIHKAKGLEWDVVLIPALEKAVANNRSRLLTWSELNSSSSSATASDPSSAEATDTAAHIMLAPIPGRGEPSKALNTWLNSIHRSRETAETKRLFYVACTRAREELHLFASPQLTSKGEPSLAADSLLKAAWPAAELHFATAPTSAATAPAIDAQTWAQAIERAAVPVESESLALAAAGVEEATEPAAPTGPILQRLPSNFDPTARFAPTKPCHSDSSPTTTEACHSDPSPTTTEPCHSERSEEPPYFLQSAEKLPGDIHAHFSRPEGSFAARSFGNAVHAFLDLLSTRILQGDSPATLLAVLPTWTPRITALLRSDGLPRTTVDRLTRDTRTALTHTLSDPNGLWLLAPHLHSASEFSLTALTQTDPAQPSRPPSVLRSSSGLQPSVEATQSLGAFAPTLPSHTPDPNSPTTPPTSIRIDRTFQAGPEPQAPGDSFLWIIDYKTTAPSRTNLDDFLSSQRATYGPQLEAYAQLLAPARAKSPQQIRLALYFPTIPHLLWWPLIDP